MHSAKPKFYSGKGQEDMGVVCIYQRPSMGGKRIRKARGKRGMRKSRSQAKALEGGQSVKSAQSAQSAGAAQSADVRHTSTTPAVSNSTAKTMPVYYELNDYTHFPELTNQRPSLPTYTDVFGSNTEATACPQRIDPKADGIQVDAKGNVHNVPSNMVQDNFGIAGLLANLRLGDRNSGARLLTIGEDLTTYGLDVASRGDIYVHFNGPFTKTRPARSPSDCRLEIDMRDMRDNIEKFKPKAPVWDPYVPETRNLGLKNINLDDFNKFFE